MCDQTEVSYLEDDVVWVKIGPIWWPGVVKDLEKDEEGRQILAGLKKKPIAVVKFFQEENYEFVKNLEHIYHYSCRRKDEFIKKGLDKFRTGASHMKKFPVDVTTAESLTNGDVNIINDPKFLPEKKESYSDIFGTGKKKNKKESESTPKSKLRASSNVTPYRPITHQRFINKVLHGESDHKVKTLIQSNSVSEDTVSGNPYKCHICKFETSRVNVIVAHHRLAHSAKNSINWTGSDSKIVKKKLVCKSRKIKIRKLFDKSTEDDSDDESFLKKKLSPKSKPVKEKPKTPEKSETSGISPPKRKTKEDTSEAAEIKKPRFTDVLLADWNEDEEEEKKDEEKKDEERKDDEKKDDEKKDEEKKNEEKKDDEKKDSPIRCDVEEDEPKLENASPESVDNSDSANKIQNEKMSCFDFDEEEEGFIGMSNANTYGRKIPRVIPVKDKPELGMDLEIEELFKKKNNEEPETIEKNVDEEEPVVGETESDEAKEKPAAGPGRRRRSKASKDEELKPNAEDSLALRRTRRPGAKKSYLNEVIEKLEDDESVSSTEKTEPEVKVETKVAETGSSSRRKQDFKQHTMDSDREEIVYSDIVNNDQKLEKKRGKVGGRSINEDLTTQIDNLLEETKLQSLPDNHEVSDHSKPSNTSFSFDYLPSESGKKTGKTRTDVKSISRMFSDSIQSSEGSEANADSQEETGTEDAVEESDVQSKTIHVGNLKFSQSTTSQKRGSIVLSSLPKSTEGQVKVVPVVRQANASKDCIVLPSGKKFDMKKQVGEIPEGVSDGETSLPKNIKAIKVKSDSLPSSLITSGKLKGQTIIHQKGGKYVIVTQPPQAGRSRATPGKVQTGSKVVILTNQLRDPKIITGGLQQKYKVEGQKVVSADSFADKDVASGSGSSGVVGQTQPIIKMVPDGKGGIMKQLTVSPKKVLLGGTKVLVSASGSTFSAGNSVQKIALSSSGGVARATSGDYRLIENYKGSGKTVLIQGGSSSGSGVVLKPSSVVPRQVTKVIQAPQTIPSLKKPKILMRASAGPGEYVVQSTSGGIESPTYVVKQKTSDGKFAAQKIVRTEIVNQPKSASPSTKTFFFSGQGSNKKGESYIITTNDSGPGKVIRMRQKLKEVDGASSKPVQKPSEVYSISQNSLLIPGQTVPENESAQIVQIPEQPEEQQSVLQTQVIAMPGPVGADGNQTYVLMSVDENGVVQGMDNSVVAYDTTAQQDPIFVNPASTSNVILINSQTNEETTPVFSTSSGDILAEALANTNVLEGNINNDMDSVVPSILLPPSIPSSVVQETSITLQKPIMTPLEMPSSVAPDTSGLEPPPLPPTPTEEDVLMEDAEIAADANQEDGKKEGENASQSETVSAYLEPENFATTESAFQIEQQNQLESTPKTTEIQEKTESYQPNAQEELKEPQEKFSLENVEEEPRTNSFQSLPVLNDEPDTSDDAQGAEPANEPHFEPEKSEQLPQALREQEPPSSTNNEILAENVTGFQNSNYHQSYDSENRENEQRIKEGSEERTEEQNPGEGGQKEKDEVIGNRDLHDSQSLPIISEENNANAYEIEPVYSDVISHKRFQEETEVSSTTDEFANKEVAN